MSEPRAATVKQVEESAATGKVAEIFADIKRTKNIDFVPAFWRTLAVHPLELELVWTTLKRLMHPEAEGRTGLLDARTRDMSLSPVWAGAVVFNLKSRRIVQIQNTYADIKRKGRLRVLDGQTPTNRVQRYELGPEWTVVPER